uniref:Pectinesterase inhibitor domain-containing protein n=1 Tax=Aegilops tauschii subsp. strangulata TaxID=200361 RepID=A0A452ZBL2_AEGTS
FQFGYHSLAGPFYKSHSCVPLIHTEVAERADRDRANMKNTPIIFTLAVSLGAIALLSGSTDATTCAGDPSMSVADACHKTSAWQGQRELELCRQTLRGARDGLTASAYGIVAVRAALESSEATEGAGKKLAQDRKISEDVRAVYQTCVDMYGFARADVAAMEGALKACSLADFRRFWEGALASVDYCARKLRLVVGDVLRRTVEADRERILLAFILGGLSFPK